MDWKVKFWGVRGSIPSPGPETVRYGGNTSCVEVRVGGQILVLDCGTGIRPLGLSLMGEFKADPIEAHLFVGHTHWDHIQGFPFFIPAYVPRNTFHIHSAHGVARSFEKIFRDQMSQNYFPVETGDMQAKLNFVHVDGPFEIGPVHCDTTFSNHPGVNLVYRFSYKGKSLVYLTDHENFRAHVEKDDAFARRQDKVIEDFVRGADLLICDAQYDDNDYKIKRGWGHSRWKDTVQLALDTGCKRLALFHHEPVRNDDQLDAIEKEAQAMAKAANPSLQVLSAKERLELTF